MYLNFRTVFGQFLDNSVIISVRFSAISTSKGFDRKAEAGKGERAKGRKQARYREENEDAGRKRARRKREIEEK